jgi:two-component system, chemotaxis family, CheB/CheR fusion protein
MPARKKKESGRTSRKQRLPQTGAGADPGELFPIVGVGASAGGIEAFTSLLGAIPADPGLSLVFVLHQDSRLKSRLASVLSRATPMQVVDCGEGASIERDRVYVAPPGSQLSIKGGRFVIERTESHATMPVDGLFRSLALDQRHRAVGVVLSGTASDGAIGTREIKAEGGITFAQDESAQFDGMPANAIATGAVDFVLSPARIGEELLHLARRIGSGALSPIQPLSEKALLDVFALLHEALGVDFTNYKPTTVERRIRRRMAISGADTLEDYLKILRENAEEVGRLYSDILIRVTGFFRDPDVFEAIRREIVPEIMSGHSLSDPVRIWVPGCATGEEVYSLAITLIESAEVNRFACPVQIFGTDVSDSAIERARLGWFPEDIAAEVSPERLSRFFVKADSGYRISKAIRDTCIFARQNLAKDPPFSRVDLISCRNVLIYLGQSLQRKAMHVFHYALKPRGYLVLGSAETIGSFGDLFAVANRRYKIYQKKAGTRRLPLPIDSMLPAPAHHREPVHGEHEPPTHSNVFREADRVLLSRYTPAGVLINEDLDILQFRGRLSPFLEPAPGQASFKILKMAREGLLGELRSAIQESRKRGAIARREGIHVRSNGSYIIVRLEVIPVISSTRERYELVLFEQTGPAGAGERKTKGAKKSAKADRSHTQLQQTQGELESTREYLQSILEEQEAMNEELRSANEEIQSSNEELQSTNEELETAKEELQSSNEELSTLNDELSARNTELAEANNDLLNLLASIDVSIIMLDSDLCIRRFNPGAQRALNIIPADVGRPITDLNLTLEVDDLDKIIAGVIEHLEVKEMEVRDRSGRWYLMRVRPYKTMENRIEGAVLVLVDVDQLKRRG